MRRRITYVLKILLLWGMSVLYVIMRACVSREERFGLLLVDIKSHFVEEPVLYQMFRNKVIVISIVAVGLLFLALVTEEFEWRGKLFGKMFSVCGDSRFIRYSYDLLIVVVAVLFCIMIKKYLQPEVVSAFSESWEGEELIAHAGGGIENHTYTNSRDAFEASYAEGIRTIELDFLVTSDDEMVCWHDWEDPINEAFERTTCQRRMNSCRTKYVENMRQCPWKMCLH